MRYSKSNKILYCRIMASDIGNHIEDLLTDNEVAEILRCSVSKVRSLRRNGVLTYLKRRPPLIAVSDLKDYLESIKVRAKLPEPEMPKSEAFKRGQEKAREIWRKYRAKYPSD